MRTAAGRAPALALACLQATRALAQTAPAPAEYGVKAEFLYNFARFVEWPPDTFHDPAAPFVIAVLGPDPFGPVLDQTMAGKTVGGRRIEVRRAERAEEVGEAQIVFVSSERGQTGAILKALDRPGLLTVGESDGFAELGGAIEFTLQERRVRFEINPRRAEEAGLKMSSQLLKLAILVPGPRS